MERPKKYTRYLTEDENTLLKFLFPIASRRLLEFIFELPYINLARRANYLGIHRLFKPNSKGDMWKLLQDTPRYSIIIPLRLFPRLILKLELW